MSDPFAGRISYLRIRSGHFQSDGTYFNATRGIPERFSGLFLPQGKEHVNVPEAKAGDIVAVAKLKESTTGDTLTTKDHPVVLPKLTVPEASIAYAIEPKAKGDEDKISTALHKLIEEDPSLHFQRDDETKEFHLSGASQLHVEIAVARLKKRYGVEVILHPPKVPYRETIKGKADAHGRHKKQSGGHGQFADCKIKVEPLPRGGEFEFVDDIYGGSIPRNFIPAVEKGIQEARRKGFLAGFPMVDFRVILYDGQYHDVDSSELAFKIAGALAYQRGDGEGEAHPPRARHERRGLDAERVRGRLDGRPLFAPRPRPGDGVGVRGHGHQGAGPHVGNADVRREPAVDHPGPRHLPHGVLPLRRGAARLAGKDHQPVQGGEGSRGKRLGKHLPRVGRGSLSPPASQPPPGLLVQQPQERPARRPHARGGQIPPAGLPLENRRRGALFLLARHEEHDPPRGIQDRIGQRQPPLRAASAPSWRRHGSPFLERPSPGKERRRVAIGAEPQENEIERGTSVALEQFPRTPAAASFGGASPRIRWILSGAIPSGSKSVSRAMR